MPEPGPNSRSKISPVSSKTIADKPSGAAGKRYGKKLSIVTSAGSAVPCEKLTDVLGDRQALNADPIRESAWAFVSGPSGPWSGFQGMFVPAFGQRYGSPGRQAAIGPPA